MRNQFKCLTGLFAVALMVALFSTSSYAVNGISVNVKSSTAGSWDFGGMHGELWRHDIVKSVVTSHRKIGNGPAQFPVISPNGQWIAYVKRTSGGAGKICLLPIGADINTVPAELTDCGELSVIDFPDNNWIYFMGATEANSAAARVFKRVNRTGSVEVVSTLDWSCSQINVSNNLLRAAFRGGDNHPTWPPGGSVIAYDMVTGGGTQYRKLCTQPASCGSGISADGQYVQISWVEHHGYNIHKWSDGTLVKGFYDSTFMAWPPNSVSTGTTAGTSHKAFDGCMATNAQKWMVLCVNNGQYLVNWLDQQCIVATNGVAAGGQSWSAGDFWVGDTTDPILKLSVDTVSLECPLGGPTPAAANLLVSNSHSTGTLNAVTTSITYVNGNNWLRLGTSGGNNNNQTISNTVNPTALAGALYKAVVTVTSANSDPVSKTYVVKLKVVVPRVFTTIAVSPRHDTVWTGEILQLSATAFDQYPESYLNPTFAWTISGGQSIDATTGLFVAGQTAGGPYTVTVSATIGGVTKNTTTTVTVKKEGYLTAMLSMRNNNVVGYETTMRLANGNFNELMNNSSLLGKHDSLIKPVSGDTATVGGGLFTWKKIENSTGTWGSDPYADHSVSYHGVNIVSPVAQTVKFVYLSHEPVKMWLNRKPYDVGYSESNEVILPVSLVNGDNYLLIRHTSFSSGSWIKFKITDAAGNSIPSLIYRYDNSPINVLPMTSNSYKVGAPMNVVWTADTANIVGALMVCLSVNGGRSWATLSPAINDGDPLYYSTGNVGRFSIVIPDSITIGTGKVSTISSTCMIKVLGAYDSRNPQPESRTQQFSVTSAIATAQMHNSTLKAALPLSYTMTQGNLAVSVNLAGTYSVEIVDLAGRRLWSAEATGAQNFILKNNLLRSGMKIVRIQSGAEILVRKIAVY